MHPCFEQGCRALVFNTRHRRRHTGGSICLPHPVLFPMLRRFAFRLSLWSAPRACGYRSRLRICGHGSTISAHASFRTSAAPPDTLSARKMTNFYVCRSVRRSCGKSRSRRLVGCQGSTLTARTALGVLTGRRAKHKSLRGMASAIWRRRA